MRRRDKPTPVSALSCCERARPPLATTHRSLKPRPPLISFSSGMVLPRLALRSRCEGRIAAQSGSKPHLDNLAPMVPPARKSAESCDDATLASAAKLAPVSLRQVPFADQTAPLVERRMAARLAECLVMIIGRDFQLGPALLIAASDTQGIFRHGYSLPSLAAGSMSFQTSSSIVLLGFQVYCSWNRRAGIRVGPQNLEY
jgi:hypothetical protein